MQRRILPSHPETSAFWLFFPRIHISSTVLLFALRLEKTICLPTIHYVAHQLSNLAFREICGLQGQGNKLRHFVPYSLQWDWELVGRIVWLFRISHSRPAGLILLEIVAVSPTTLVVLALVSFFSAHIATFPLLSVIHIVVLVVN